MILTIGEFNRAQQEISSLRRALLQLLDGVVWDETEFLPAFREHVIHVEDTLDALRDELNEFVVKVRGPE